MGFAIKLNQKSFNGRPIRVFPSSENPKKGNITAKIIALRPGAIATLTGHCFLCNIKDTALVDQWLMSQKRTTSSQSCKGAWLWCNNFSCNVHSVEIIIVFSFWWACYNVVIFAPAYNFKAKVDRALQRYRKSHELQSCFNKSHNFCPAISFRWNICYAYKCLFVYQWAMVWWCSLLQISRWLSIVF